MKIPLYKNYTDKDDIRAVSEVLKRGHDWAIGPEIEQFEKRVASYIGRKYAVAFNSGTSALHASMIACGIGKGDQVIVPSFTFIATANAPLFVGASPVFADIESETYGLNPDEVCDVVTTKTKAVIPVHVGGLVCSGIQEIENMTKGEILVIEDACEALGSFSGNGKRSAGAFGDISILSFCANKLISTGEGGMALTDNKYTYETLRLILSHGRIDSQPYFTSTLSPDYVSLGYNWRMSSMTAALGLSQTNKLDRAIALRRKAAKSLSEKLFKVKEIETPYEPSGFHTYQMYTIKVNAGSKTRNKLKEYLTHNGISSKVYFEPIHLTSFYKGMKRYSHVKLPITEDISKRVLTLPLYPTMSNEEIQYIGDTVSEFFEVERRASH